jgi:hypothetical protein
VPTADALSELAKVWNCSRFVLAQPATQADELQDGIRTGDLPDDYQDRRFIMDFGTPEAPSYIVGDRGVFTTRLTLPTWADAPDVLRLGRPPRQTGSILLRIRDAATALSSIDPTLYKALGVEETLQAVERHYREGEQAHDSYSALIPRSTDELVELLESREKARAWAVSSFEAARDGCLELKLSIPQATPMVATLGLFALSSNPELLFATSVLRQLQPKISFGELLELVQRPEPAIRAVEEAESLNEVGVILSVSLYLGPADSTDEGALQTAWDVAGSYEAAGNSAMNAASKTSSVQLFFATLVHGHLYFRAADLIYASLERFSESTARPGLLFSELATRRIICEERRAVILSSLIGPLGLPDKLNPTDPNSIGEWINSLAAMPSRQARALAHDEALRMMIPRFLRELVLGSVYRLHGETTRARDTLTRVLSQLEADEARNARLPTEVNLMPALMQELAATYEALGEDDEAKRFRLRAEAAMSTLSRS